MKKNKAVFHDLGFSEKESVSITLKSDLHLKILDVIERQKTTPRELEKILNVPQPRISELLNGKISTLSIEKLISYLEKLGVITSVNFKYRRAD